MANELVQVPFHGDIIEAVQDERGDVWVPIRRPCEVFGLDSASQRTKLKGKAWARDVMITSPDARGHQQELYALHLDCLPMWLATIDANRVKKDIRPKLELYQKEAARVLADHFLGRRQAQTEQLNMAKLFAEMSAQIASQVALAVGAVLSQSMESCRRVSDLITVEERCRQRWPEAGAKQRRRVRDVAIGIFNERTGEFPFKLTGKQNGAIVFEREHLDILDRAIDVVIEETTGNQMAPLFMRPSSN